MFERTEMAPFPGKQPFDADLASPLFVRPAVPISGHKTLAVVLMHRGIDALLRIRRGGDQIDSETLHGVLFSSSVL
jgi:hypothetical protein